MHHFLLYNSLIHQAPFGQIHADTFRYQYKPRKLWTKHHSVIQLTLHTSPKFYIMDATHHWLFAKEYSIWNATATALQFLTEDLKPHIVSDAIEQVYTAFFCSNSAQQLWNLSEEILFSHFMTTLNDTFKRELKQEDEGYESGNESLNIPTPVRGVPQIFHVSTSKICLLTLPHYLLQLNNTQNTHLED